MNTADSRSTDVRDRSPASLNNGVTEVTEVTAPNDAACSRYPDHEKEVTGVTETLNRASITTASAIRPHDVPPPTPATPGVPHRPSYATYDDHTTYGPPGLYYHGKKLLKSGEVEPFDHWLCGPIHADAMTCDEQGYGFGIVIRFLDMRGRWKTWAMPMRLLSGDGQELRAELLDMGLRIEPSRHKRLSHWLASRTPIRALVAATRTGWHQKKDSTTDGMAFVMPHKTLGSDHIVFQHEQAQRSPYQQRGTLEQWRAMIGKLCQDNPLMLLTVSASLAGPLLKLTHHQGAGLHLIGDSSSGKSTLLQVATSVWGAPDFMRTWRATANGLEGVAAEHNDTCVILDEISEADPREIGAIVYALGNGTGKSRAGRAGNSRQTARWRIVALSSGERSISAHMLEGGKRIKAGQEVRLLNITAQRSHGVFDALHDSEDGRALSDRLKHATGHCYGTLGPAFIERLQSDTRDMSTALHTIRCLQAFQGEHGIEHRAATAFALMGMAGELATEYGLTGWTSGDAVQAAIEAFKRWRSERGGGQTETRQILDTVRDFIDRHSESRFSPMEANEHAPLVRDRVGWWRSVNHQRVFMFTAGGLREATQGYDFRRVLAALEEGGFFYRTSDEKRAVTTRTPEGTKKLYHLVPTQEDRPSL